jgi:DNA polymerase III subunit beta
MHVDNLEGSESLGMPAKLLIDALTKLDPDVPINFSSKVLDNKSTEITVSTATGKFKLMAVNGDEYPSYPKIKGTKLELNSNDILTAFKKCPIIIHSNSNLKPILMSVLLDIKNDGIDFVSSNSNEMSNYSIKCESKIEGQLVISEKPVQVIKSIVPRNEQVNICFNEKNAEIIFANYKLIFTLQEGSYPNWQSVIPKNNNKLIVNRQELINKLNLVSVFANQKSNLIILNIQKQLLISSQDIDFSISAKETMNCEYEGEAIEIGLKSSYLINLLSLIDTEMVLIEISDAKSAIIMKPIGENYNEFQLLMPMTIE